MTRPLLIICLMLFVATSAFSQFRHHATYLELGGAAWVYSFNYEYQTERKFLTRAGVSFLYQSFFMPVSFGKLFGRTHNLEVSAGLTYMHLYTSFDTAPSYHHSISATPFIGYRYQKDAKPFFAKVGFSPFCIVYSEGHPEDIGFFRPWGAVAFGHRF